jgi:hypothetical protein
MHEELSRVAEHIKGLGLAALAHAQQHTFFYSMDNPYWNDLAVLQAAHAAEILVKARIAEQHPLLIFNDIPRSTKVNEEKLSLRALLESGKTLQYNELPERLWATTGYKIKDENLYQRFGKLRNAIQHCTTPQERDLMQETLEFIFGIIDPMIHDFWSLYAVDYIEDPDAHDYIFETLLKLNISFLIPDHYKDRVERDRTNLQDLVKVITFVKDFISDVELITQVDKLKIIREIQEKFEFSESKAEGIYYDAYEMLSKNNESYHKWRITPL